MKIVSSKFKDYYDGVQAYGYDASVIYVRSYDQYGYQRYSDSWTHQGVAVKDVPEIVKEFRELAKALFPKKTLARRRPHYSDCLGVTLVAGRLYPFARIVEEGRTLGENKTHFIYDAATLNALAPADDFLSVTKNQVLANRDAFFGLKGSETLREWAIKHRVVAMRYTSERGVEINPRLADQELARVLPPFEAAQEIEMFLSNLAAPDRVPVVIEDKYKIPAHGFDKHSFRKRPQAS